MAEGPSCLNPDLYPGMALSKLIENTELHVQQLFDESYLETGMGPQGLAGVELFVSKKSKTPALKYVI